MSIRYSLPLQATALLLIAALAMVLAFRLWESSRAAAAGPTCNVPGTYASIQQAVSDSGCATINVAAGTYAEYDIVIGRNVTITGNPGAPGTVIVDAGSTTRRGFYINASVVVTVAGLTIQHGSAGGSGGAIENHGALTLNDSIIMSNTITGGSGGGGIYNAGSAALHAVVLSGNTAPNLSGGALYNAASGVLTLTNVSLSGNSGNSATNGGGGIYNNGTATLINSTLSGNSATFDGSGGGILNASSGTATLTNSTLSGNSASDGGGINNNGSMTLNNVTLSGNWTLNNGGGGGINNSGTATLNNSTLSGNLASYGGGINNNGSMTLTNSTLSGNPARYGGGIFNNGTATLSNSTLSGNSAGIDGGGIYNYVGTATATLTNVTLSGNWTTTGSGGGLYNYAGTATLNNVTLSGNWTTTGSGGGIANGGTATLSNSTLSGNSAIDYGGTASTDGGGILNYDVGTATLTNVTLSGNWTTGAGGGIANGGRASAYNSTIVFNQADSTNRPNAWGGGVYNVSGKTFYLRNSLVAGNRQGNGTNDCAGTLDSYGRNLFFVGGCTIVDGAGGGHAFLSTMASIGALQNNGGPTLTHMPRLGSEMIDGGDPSAGCLGPTGALLLFDQRGKTRPIDGDGNGSPICDVGAVERQLADSELAPRLYLPLIRR